MLAKVLPSRIIATLNMEPSIAQVKNTFDGEKRSAIVKIAKISVPEINPNCTADVK